MTTRRRVLVGLGLLGAAGLTGPRLLHNRQDAARERDADAVRAMPGVTGARLESHHPLMDDTIHLLQVDISPTATDPQVLAIEKAMLPWMEAAPDSVALTRFGLLECMPRHNPVFDFAQRRRLGRLPGARILMIDDHSPEITAYATAESNPVELALTLTRAVRAEGWKGGRGELAVLHRADEYNVSHAVTTAAPELQQLEEALMALHRAIPHRPVAMGLRIATQGGQWSARGQVSVPARDVAALRRATKEDARFELVVKQA